MKTRYLINAILVFFIVFGGVSLNVNAQKKAKSRLRVYYEQQADNNKKISVILIQGKGKNMGGVENAEIFLSAVNGEEEIPLTSILTDENGEAALLIEPGYIFPKNEEGFVVINGLYNGNDTLKSSSKSVEFKDLKFDVSFEVVDSLKHVSVYAYELDSLGEKTPVEEVEFKIGVERLHSILYLEVIETDEDGLAEMEFPNDIPGDASGKINVIVRVEEDKTYGTITQAIEIDWGLMVDYTVTSDARTLYGDEAPLWMTVSIFVILIGAWFHFIFAGYKVYQMSKN